MKLTVIILLSFMVFTACSDRIQDEPETVSTEIHLQSGFFGQVTIWINGEKVFDEMMSSQVPFAGPQNQFALSMDRGTSTIKISWGDSAARLTDESSVRIGSFDEYFLGINIIDDSLSLLLQNSQFLYL